MVVKFRWINSGLGYSSFEIPGSTTVVKGKIVPVTTFLFIERGSKLVF